MGDDVGELVEELDEQLQLLGTELTAEELRTCGEVCVRRGMSAELFAESWVAFGLSSGESLKPEAAALAHFERSLDAEKDKRRTEDPRRVPGAQIAQNDDTLAGYLPTHQSVNIEQSITATNVKDPISTSLRPETYTATTQSTKYTSRTNAGDIVCNFGSESKLAKCIWTNMSTDTCTVTQTLNHSNNVLTSKAMYGFELLQNKASLLDNNIKYLSQCVTHKANIKETLSVKCKSQIPVAIVGRIDCDANGRLNPKSVLLQGTWEESLGHKVSIDLDQLKQYSLFPGQVVAMTGLNSHGDKFVAHDVYYDGSFTKINGTLLDNSVTAPLHVVAACGPFTTTDSLNYDPLNDYIQYITQHRPHVAIFIGPFLDANHQSVLENLIAETYKMFFEKLVEKIMSVVEPASPHTKVVFVSSPKDVFHTCIYPSPPFYVKKNYSNLVLAPDPCMLNVAGVNIGITSTDILMHLSKEEISLPLQGPDKLGRLASHLLSQQSFYPLWPPSPVLSVDTALWSEFSCMVSMPHVLIVPSDFRYFTKEINGCLVVNPEHLTKGIGSGTFMRMQINNSESNIDNMFCQIVRI